MPAMIVRRRLGTGEFDAWQSRFKARAADRAAAGCTGVQYYRLLDDPDEVVMIFSWETEEHGLAFVDAMIEQFPNLMVAGDDGRPGMDYRFGEIFPPLAS